MLTAQKGKLLVSAAAGSGKPHNDPENQCACRLICAKLLAANVQTVFGKSEWKWLQTYIMSVQSDLTDDLTAAAWRYAIAAFFLQSQHSAWPASADFSTAGKPSAWGPAYQKAHGGDATGGTTTKVEVTLPTKIEGSAYTLPTPTKAGYVFLGWYDSNSTSGNKLTSLPVGWKGTVYALWREAKVAWELNGGKVYEEKTTTTGGGASNVTVPTNAELWEAFKPYYNTFYGLNRADQTIENVASFAAAYMYKIMTDASSEYKWLGDYINSVATAQGFTLAEDEASWRWHAWAFFNASQHTSWPTTADFTEAGKPEKWGPAYQAAKGGSTGGTTTTTKVEVTLPSKITGAPYTIPTPEKDGAEFLGWYDTNDTSGNKLTVLPVGYDGTVYAIWKENGPTTDVENVRQELDFNAPMYDVLGRQVDATYRGIVIQNGNKYLLR